MTLHLRRIILTILQSDKSRFRQVLQDQENLHRKDAKITKKKEEKFGLMFFFFRVFRVFRGEKSWFS
jgi:hypothetical protein